MEYREVTKYDDNVFHLVVKMLHEIDYDYNTDNVDSSLRTLFASQSFKCYGAYSDGKLVGVLGFIIFPELYDYSKLKAHEQFFYVLPKYRGAGVGLIKYIAKNMKCDIITFGVENPKLRKLLSILDFQEEKLLMSRAV